MKSWALSVVAPTAVRTLPHSHGLLAALERPGRLPLVQIAFAIRVLRPKHDWANGGDGRKVRNQRAFRGWSQDAKLIFFTPSRKHYARMPSEITFAARSTEQPPPCRGLAAEFADFGRALRGLLDPYQPERHYMRGPGPKWHAKHTPAAPVVDGLGVLQQS